LVSEPPDFGVAALGGCAAAKQAASINLRVARSGRGLTTSMADARL